MNILIVDGQGGGVGKTLVAGLKKSLPEIRITAVGTNCIATSVMKKAGADIAATGENAIRVNAARADIIAGPLGIIVPDSLYGEITGEMAAAIAAGSALKVLVPFNNCGVIVAGTDEKSAAESLEKALQIIEKAAKKE